MSLFERKSKINQEPIRNGELEDVAVNGAENRDNTPNWLRRNLQPISVLIFAGGLLLSIAHNPKGTYDEAKFELLHDGIAVSSSFVATEAMFVAGLGMMLKSSNKRLSLNPTKMVQQMEEAKLNSSNSSQYKYGLAINTLGAIGTAGVAIGATVSGLPPQAWAGVIGWATFDIVSTCVSRAGLYASIPNEVAPISAINGEIENGI